MLNIRGENKADNSTWGNVTGPASMTNGALSPIQYKQEALLGKKKWK